MRNDLKDEPLVVPSLTVDDGESVTSSHGGGESRNKKQSGSSKGFVVFLFLLLLVACCGGVGWLYWMFKQSTDELRSQLAQATNSTSQITESNLTRWQEVTKQLAEQQQITKTSLEALRTQNKQLAEQLNKALTSQQTALKQQVEQNNRLQKLEQQITGYDDKIKQLTADVVALKQAQNTVSTDIKGLQDKKIPQTIQSIQDDLLLLRSQLDASSSNDAKQSLTKLEKQMQSLQSQVDTLRQQLSSRSLY